MVWPTSVATDSDLFVAKNNLFTTLNGAIDASTTTVILTDASSFPTAGYVTVDTEAIKYTGKAGNTLTGVTRGSDGTTATSHANGAFVFHFLVANHHNVLKDEIKSLEQNLSDRIGTGTGSLKVKGPEPWLDVTAYGLVGDGSTDNTSALQTLLTGISQDSTIYFPAGDFKINGAVTYSGVHDLRLIGAGKNASRIHQFSSTSDTFIMATDAHVEFEHLWIKNQPVPTAGSGIKFSGNLAQVNAPIVSKCRIEGQWQGVICTRTNQFLIIGNDFVNHVTDGIFANDPDSNDSAIVSNFLGTSISGVNSGIQMTKSPGLRICANKVLGFKYGLLVSLEETTSTVNVTGNSFENQATAGIQLQLSVAAKTIGSVAITGNEFAQHPTCIFVSNNGAFIDNVCITGNTFGAFTTGIDIRGGTRFTVVGNDFSGGTTGISTTGALVVTGGSNGFTSVTTPFSGNDAALTSRGATGAPSHSFAEDTDIGMWSPGANILGWSVNGAEGMRLNTTGLEVNTTLAVGATSAAYKAVIQDSSKNLYLKQTNADNGWIIGAADADGKLHIFRRGEGGSPSDNERITVETDGRVGVGGTANANAILDLQSTTKPFMPPRMTTTQRDAVASPTAGMVIYNSTTNKLNVYTTAWEAVTSV